MICSPHPLHERSKVGCIDRETQSELRSFADIVRHYIAHYQNNADRDLSFYAEQPSLARVIELAGLAQRSDGRRQPHQRRLAAASLQHAQAALRLMKFETCRDFSQLIQAVRKAIGGIDGIGALMVYDTARRIGAYLKLNPEKVYLHAGTLAGARALGFGPQLAVEIDDLPDAFRALGAGEIEDCLCIYKDAIRRIIATK